MFILNIFKYNNKNKNKIQNIKLLFFLCDKNKNGVIEFQEFKKLFTIYRILSGKNDGNMFNNIAQLLFDKIDKEKTGFVKINDLVIFYQENPHFFNARSPRPSPKH